MRSHLLAMLALVGACASGARPATAPSPAQETSAARQDSTRQPGAGAISTPNADPFPSTYAPFASRPTLIRNATVMTAAGPTIPNGSVLLRDGKVMRSEE